MKTIYQFLQPFLDGRPFLIATFASEYVMQVVGHIDSIVEVAYEKTDGEFRVITFHQSDLQAICEWKLVDYFGDHTELKCECGAESIGVSAHSHWCAKAAA